jgi:hypothetical protein
MYPEIVPDTLLGSRFTAVIYKSGAPQAGYSSQVAVFSI